MIQVLDGNKLNHDEWINYYENGMIEKKSFYNKGKPDGEWTGYYKNGKLKYKMVYENCSYKSFIEFDEMDNQKN